MTGVAKSLIANATRQAHWQAHKTHRIPIESIGTKELAFLLGLGNTLRCDTVKNATLYQRTEERANVQLSGPDFFREDNLRSRK
jgi:hypothetical protein